MATSSKLIFLRRAISWAVKVTKRGSFRLPLLGTGARNGASVSMSIEFIGIWDATFLTEDAFLYVTVPGIDI